MLLLRSVGLTSEDLAQERTLLRGPGPVPDGFLTRAFRASTEAANTAYRSPFIDGIRTGSLSPDRYGAVNVLDAYYCYEAAKSIWEGCRKSQAADQGLYRLQSRLYNGYAAYNATFYEYWHVLTSKSVSPTDHFREYAAHERAVSLNDEPIYLLAALLPCYYLWYWMADKIHKDPAASPGVYRGWVDGNRGDPLTAYLVDEFINQWRLAGRPFDEAKAIRIFATSMEYESKVFDECGYPA